MMLDDEALAENDRSSLAADCQQVHAVAATIDYVDISLSFMALLLVFVCACDHSRICLQMLK